MNMADERHELPNTSSGASTSRYDALLRQIVQLNTDLQKTAALSQSLQRERDGLQQNNAQLTDELKRLHERCDKLQQIVMKETELKIESDKKHEALIAKWKKQLETKAKAFESLQRKLAPPRDLEQLRLQIQQELEGPHQQRLELLQEQVEKHRQVAFSVRRDYEILKTEYEQFVIDQGHEMEVLHQTHELKVNEVQKKLDIAVQNSEHHHVNETLRRLEQQYEAAQVENKLLREEIRDVREDFKRKQEQFSRDKAELEAQLTEEKAYNATSELDQKALSRQLAKAKAECDGFRAKWMTAEAKLLDMTTEIDKLKEQIKQKETLVLNSHTTQSTKLREERAAWEREQVALTERVAELSQKLQAAEVMAQKAASSSHEAATESQHAKISSSTTLLLKQKEEEAERYHQQALEMDKKIGMMEDELRRSQQSSEEAMQKLRAENEQLRKSTQSMQAERDHAVSKHTAAQELVSKVKAESLVLRAKVKEMESEYKTLQAKHREIIQCHEDMQLEKEQATTKLRYLEQDCALLTEKLEKEKEVYATSIREWKKKCSALETDCRAQKGAIKQEMRAAVTKAIHELSKSQKKQAAYKKKCLQAHERYKLMLEDLNAYETRIAQLKQEHAVELQQLLSQLTAAENEKIRLLTTTRRTE